MAPHRESNFSLSQSGSYGSITSSLAKIENEKKKLPPTTGSPDQDQLRLLEAYQDKDLDPSMSQHQQTGGNENNSRSQWRQMAICLLCGLLGGLLLSSACFSGELSRNTVRSNQSSSAASSPHPSKDQDQVSDDLDRFEYIVVGGGPAGILAASRLAREIPTARVALLESGTTSQTSVLASLSKQQAKKRRKQRAESEAETTATIINVEGTTEGLTVGEASSSAGLVGGALDKFDCPLMWSAVAGTERRIQQTFQLQPDPKTSTYWPVPGVLLARGLGGCGLHNAMIYVRSLPSCFEKWNLTNWDFYEHMLPVYKALETFVPFSQLPSTLVSNNQTGTSTTRGDWLEHRGRNGPIRTSTAGPQLDKVGEYFIESALASGLPWAGANHTGGGAGSFNHIGEDDRIGVGYYEFNIRNGVRHSVANAMLGIRGSTPTWKFPPQEASAESSKQQYTTINDDGIPSNLLVLIGYTVTELMWDKSTMNGIEKPRARGVSFVNHANGKQGNILLRQSTGTKGPLPQVILAAGSIMTPQVLWNSGIGDGGSVANLTGVGKNLMDHPVLGMAYQLNPEITQDATPLYAVADEMEDYALAVQVLNSLDDQTQPDNNHPGGSGYHHNHDREELESKLGTFGTPGFSVGAFLRSPWAEKESRPGASAPPDIQLTVFPRVIEPHQPNGKVIVDTNLLQSKAMLVTVALLQPDARYEVKPGNMKSLRSASHPVDQTASNNTSQATATSKDAIASAFANALQYPLPSIVLPKGKKEYLTNKDVERLAWGMRQAHRIMTSHPMSNFTKTQIYPGPSVMDVEGAEETLHQYIRANQLANSHWVGTAKMGNDDDPLAVLDESLRVRLVDGLRVFDAAAIPYVPNGNTHSTVCAVASRGVDLILAERKAAER
ncbi:Oxygen-dependent choline dehydrogenase [Seminavis robusta]|uniref:Oxygen-dependent choline dehydrogenase n=1 Tax=Seminavis robusta TaxID=568900 RepID=A0A9N8DLR3_9STRA|nr:Oxygen-dependent choline dehydrogenase [Seminavis robusta]|eukprot:Sro125_g060170.1 Oxygen-dependent choline dehydrogenase (893) ;mRNA; f:32716-35483